MSSLRIGGRRSAILPTLVIAAVVMVAFAIFTNIWTKALWFRSFSFGSVFSTMLLTQAGLFVGFGLIMATAVAANAAIAYRMRPGLRAQPAGSPLLARYREVLDTRFVLVMVAVGVVVGLFAGGAAAGQALTYLSWRNGTPFGTTDPQFGLDIGFFVFSYPWWRFVLSFLFAVLGFSVVISAAVHYVTGSFKLGTPRRGATVAAQAHLSILIGLAVIVKAVSYWFDQYGLEITNSPTNLITGIGYTADNATVKAKMILAISAGIIALLFFANAILRRWIIPTIGLILLIVSAIVLGLIYPGAVQYFSVKPNERVKERAYIERNIAATRTAYGVDKAEVTDYSAKTSASADQLRTDAEALPGIRLLDPNVVSPAYDQLQQVRSYYTFPNNLDVDRYQIDGKETDTVVAVRELNADGIDAGSQNWNNLRTVYTHGYGLVAAYGNTTQPSGEPKWLAEQIPPVGKITEHEPRIYFGEFGRTANSVRTDDYSIVGAPAGTPPVELDTPGGGENGGPKTYTYTGTGGVGMGSWFRRLLFAAKFADVNILLSDLVNPSSKIIYDRTPLVRVQQAAPWLTVDRDTYPAVVDGRIVWIVDGYTTSNSYPNSQRVSLNQVTTDAQNTATGSTVAPQVGQDINYLRNSVKAVVDAYDGTVKLYAWDESDPLLRTWQKVFPQVISPKSSISPELLSHLRYPQDLFKVQRQILARYHQTDPNNWYQQTSLWQVPKDPISQQSQGALEPPFYLSVKWPGDEKAIFSLTTSFVPNGRDNLAGYMAVNGDASSPDYGRLRILSMSDTTQIDGPGQAFTQMSQNEAVRGRLLPFTTSNSAPRYGNLLTLPLGGGLLYVTPVYAQRQSGNGNYPVLRLVVVRFGQQVGIGETLQEALNQVFKGDTGTGPDAPEEPGQTPSDPDNPAASKAIAEAKRAFADANKALTAGDLAGYQAKIKEGEAAVERARQALGG